MVDQKVLSLRQQQTPSCQRIFLELIAISWTRSFILRLTKSGPKSRDHPLVLLEFEKIMLLYCWLKVYKMGLELICFWLTVSTNRESARIWNAWKDFCLFRHKFGCSWLGLAVKKLQWKVVYHFCSDKAICVITVKQHKYRFLVLKRNIHNMKGLCALQTFVAVCQKHIKVDFSGQSYKQL